MAGVLLSLSSNILRCAIANKPCFTICDVTEPDIYLTGLRLDSLSVKRFFWWCELAFSVCGLGAEGASGCGLASVWVGFGVLSMLL